MRAHIDLKLSPSERSALKALTAEEREAVLDDLLQQAREDLEWVLARAAVEEATVAAPPPVPPSTGRRATHPATPPRRPAPRSWITGLGARR